MLFKFLLNYANCLYATKWCSYKQVQSLQSFAVPVKSTKKHFLSNVSQPFTEKYRTEISIF